MESSTTTSRVNIVFFTESESESRDLAGKILTNKHSEDVWQHKVDGVDVFGYIRWPAAIPTATPVGITDILIVHVSTDASENWQSAKNYVDSRRGIPFKFLSSALDLSAQAASLDCEFVNVAEVTGDNFRDKVIRSALNLEKTLLDTFSKIDCDADGFIEAEEIIAASKSLGHRLNDEDAKEIVKSLSADGKVNFQKFKQWWVMGRADFGAFRKIVELEMIMHKYIKQSSDVFNSYLEKIQKEGQNIANQETGYEGRVSIGSVQEFESGIALGVHLTAGSDFNGIVDSFPAELRESPASFGLELKLKKAEDAKDLIEGIEMLKEMISKVIPMVDFLFQSGSLSTTTRQVGTSVFLDLIPSGGFREQMSGVLSMFDMSQINFNGISDIHIATKFALKDLFEKGLSEIFQNVFHFRFEGKHEWGQLKNLFRFICDMLANLPPILPFDLKHLAFGLRLIYAFRKNDFDFKFDAKTLFETFIDVYDSIEMAEPGWDNQCTQWAHNKSIVLKDLKTVPPQVKAVMNPLKKALQAMNLDDISVYATAPLLKVHLKVKLMVKGLSEKVDDVFYCGNETESE